MTSEVRPHGEAVIGIKMERKSVLVGMTCWMEGRTLYPRGVTSLLSPQPFATSVIIGCLFGFCLSWMYHINGIPKCKLLSLAFLLKVFKLHSCYTIYQYFIPFYCK